MSTRITSTSCLIGFFCYLSIKHFSIFCINCSLNDFQCLCRRPTGFFKICMFTHTNAFWWKKAANKYKRTESKFSTNIVWRKFLLWKDGQLNTGGGVGFLSVVLCSGFSVRMFHSAAAFQSDFLTSGEISNII